MQLAEPARRQREKDDRKSEASGNVRAAQVETRRDEGVTTTARESSFEATADPTPEKRDLAERYHSKDKGNHKHRHKAKPKMQASLQIPAKLQSIRKANHRPSMELLHQPNQHSQGHQPNRPRPRPRYHHLQRKSIQDPNDSPQDNSSLGSAEVTQTAKERYRKDPATFGRWENARSHAQDAAHTESLPPRKKQPERCGRKV